MTSNSATQVFAIATLPTTNCDSADKHDGLSSSPRSSSIYNDTDYETVDAKIVDYNDDLESAPLNPKPSTPSHRKESSRSSFWCGALAGTVVILVILATGGAFVQRSDAGTRFLRDQLERLQNWKEQVQMNATTNWANVDTFFIL